MRLVVSDMLHLLQNATGAIWLDGNNITGNIPPCFLRAPALTELVLESNK
jgi:hypothetical protein